LTKVVVLTVMVVRFVKDLLLNVLSHAMTQNVLTVIVGFQMLLATTVQAMA
jgi:hypothetical protein